MIPRGIYVPTHGEGYELCHPKDSDAFASVVDLVERGRGPADLSEIPFELVQVNMGRRLAPSDSPWFGLGVLIFTEKARSLMGSLMENYGSFLPLVCDSGGYWAFRCTSRLDALDEEASQISWLGDDRILEVERHVFRPDVVKDIAVFKIPKMKICPTFVSEVFVELWTSHGLKGLGFRRVWDAEGA